MTARFGRSLGDSETASMEAALVEEREARVKLIAQLQQSKRVLHAVRRCLLVLTVGAGSAVGRRGRRSIEGRHGKLAHWQSIVGCFKAVGCEQVTLMVK